VSFSAGPQFFVRRRNESLAQFVYRLAGRQLELSAAELEKVIRAADSVDRVEFVTELEHAMQSRR
jgi:hypothetical protein